MKISGFLLSTGYRVIGEVIAENDESFEMKDVAAYTFQEAKEGMSVSFGAFAPEAVDNRLFLYKSQVLSSFSPDTSILNHYQTVFGHIVTPPSTLQMLN